MRKHKFITKREFGIFTLTFALIVTGGSITAFVKNAVIEKRENNIIYIEKTKKIDSLIFKSKKEKIIIIPVNEVNPEKDQSIEFKITAYDLSIASTGKTKYHPAYGISRSGIDLKGKDWETARVVSVDPNIIPLGSKVLIEFKDDGYKKYNGVYLTEDIGNGIKGRHIDLFLGDYKSNKQSKEALDFGIAYANVTILE